jgi:hypothetical protein
MNPKPESRDYKYAVNLVHSICCLAGVPSYVDDLRADLRDNGVLVAVNNHDTARLFDWLMSILSFQGIANRVAEDFIHKHGNVGWSDIEQALAASPSCPKLGGYWLFHDCRYHKTSAICTEPDHFAACPLPRHLLRNGRLNQTAYSLALFIRDVAAGDLVHWIDQQLTQANAKSAMNVATAREALVGPLQNVYGVSDKMLALAFSVLLMGAGKRRPLWFRVGASFVVIDTLVHNFLHRTGILQRFAASHPYGSGCYQPGGAVKSSSRLLLVLTLVRSTVRFRKSFFGLCKVPSGATALTAGSTSAMAIGSTTGTAATTSIVDCTVVAIELPCSRKTSKKQKIA